MVTLVCKFRNGFSAVAVVYRQIFKIGLPYYLFYLKGGGGATSRSVVPTYSVAPGPSIKPLLLHPLAIRETPDPGRGILITTGSSRSPCPTTWQASSFPCAALPPPPCPLKRPGEAGLRCPPPEDTHLQERQATAAAGVGGREGVAAPQSRPEH